MADDKTTFATRVDRVVVAYSMMQESHEYGLVLTERVVNAIRYGSMVLYYSAARKRLLEAWSESGALKDGALYLELYEKYRTVRNKEIAHPNEGSDRLDLSSGWDWYRVPTRVRDAMHGATNTSGDGPAFRMCRLPNLTSREWLDYRDLTSVTAELYLMKQYEIWHRMGVAQKVSRGVSMPGLLHAEMPRVEPMRPDVELAVRDVEREDWVPESPITVCMQLDERIYP